MALITLRKWDKTLWCQAEFYTQNMQVVLNNLDSYIAKPWKVLKDDPTSTVVVVEIDGKFFVIKRANTKNIWHAIRRSFCRSRAKKNWHNAKKLSAIGISTFTPVALYEERFGLLKGRSYFLCTYLQGIDALHYFAKGAQPQKEWDVVAQNIGKMIQRLAAHWLSHRDLNLSNIILINHQPWLIDLESMCHHRWRLTARLGSRKERIRFMENWQEAPEVSPQVAPLFQTVLNQLDCNLC